MLQVGVVRLDRHRFAKQLSSLLLQAASPVEVGQSHQNRTKAGSRCSAVRIPPRLRRVGAAPRVLETAVEMRLR
jgi:hypothetical protein